MKINPKINLFFKNHSSTILTVIGSIGVGVTAVLSARDTVKAIKRINYERGYQNKEFNTKEKIKIAAPCYVPTILTGASTILCICGANKLNKNIQKSLTSAYVLLDRTYKEYRNSVKETYGVDGDLNVIKHIGNKMIDEADISMATDEALFFDFFNLQFFSSSLAKIREAEGIANEMLKNTGYISLKTMCYLLGEDEPAHDYALGWSLGAGQMYGYDKIEILVEEAVREDGSKYYVIDFINGPTDDYTYYL